MTALQNQLNTKVTKEHQVKALHLFINLCVLRVLCV